jgi:hypothetical protein
VGEALALVNWAPALLFVSGLGLVERAWMRGPGAPLDATVGALLPSLSAAAWLGWRGQTGLAIFLGLWSLRAACLVRGRRGCDSAALPAFRSIRAFGRETRWWVAGFVGLWLLGW